MKVYRNGTGKRYTPFDHSGMTTQVLFNPGKGSEKVREVNLMIEQKAWGAFRTEFYLLYDFMPVLEKKLTAAATRKTVLRESAIRAAPEETEGPLWGINSPIIPPRARELSDGRSGTAPHPDIYRKAVEELAMYCEMPENAQNRGATGFPNAAMEFMNSAAP